MQVRNSYYCSEQFQIVPSYYYNSPYEEQQVYKNTRIASLIQTECQTEATIDYDYDNEEDEVASLKSSVREDKEKELFQLLESEVSVINTDNREENFKPYGLVCLPSISIYLNNCHFQIACAKLGRIKCSILLVPYYENRLAQYSGTLFKENACEKIEKRLKSKPNQEGNVYYLKSITSMPSTFSIFAYLKLGISPKKSYLAGICHLLTSAKDVMQGQFKDILIPYLSTLSVQEQEREVNEAKEAKEVLQKILSYIQSQKNCFFKKITLNCQSVKDFCLLTKIFNELIKVFYTKDYLTI